MSITLNMTGGTSVRAYAYIVVGHDTSATITCTNSRKIIPLSTGMTLILVADGASSCVVTATISGNVSNTATVTVTSGGSYYVPLYNIHRFILNGSLLGSPMTRKGSINSTVTAPAAYQQTPNVSAGTGYIEIEAGNTGGYNGAGIAYFPETIDLSKYSKIHAKGTTRNNTGMLAECALNVWTSIESAQATNRIVDVATLSASSSTYVSFELEVDISEYTNQAVYIGFNTRRNNSGYSGVRLTDVWVD